MFYLRTNVDMPSSTGSFVIVSKSKGKDKFRTAANLLFSILLKYMYKGAYFSNGPEISGSSIKLLPLQMLARSPCYCWLQEGTKNA
jgi:hypothetical protein